ncbi:MAG: 2-C-methyl-D-erythritol 2,4-cyclodiphosphate synthase [Firmicutes bacterium]|nr:2-C-methyl-D-erythritol 2,4-cyclodiphosphate synthase [Bacillota bacterium]MCL5038672.1 2-C-methyl-D-erythritol 2,4-cyclodiphosphate synthase [Bacillota bacterium]
MRVGIGYDVHRLVPARPLILGGVQIPFENGLEGHSDADVLIHALMDALLGAAGKLDIGHLFPNTDPRYAGIASTDLLGEVMKILRQSGLRVVNVDLTIVADKPKISSYIQEMKKNLAPILGLLPEDVGIKATTNEGLGFLGRGEGMAALAVASLRRCHHK